MDQGKINQSSAIILDLDGVITQTATLHEQAWKKMFDAFLKKYGSQKEFSEEDYELYVDGKPRYDGVRSFLESRDIEIKEGSEKDETKADTIYGLGKRKNQFFLELLERQGAQVYEDTVSSIRKWKKEGKKLAVVSSSKNCRPVLEKANLIELFDTIVDGTDALDQSLKGKPDPDIFLEAAHRLEVEPSSAVVFEDAIAGVEAGSRGKFGLVIGINRSNDQQKMKEAGAHLVINSLSELNHKLTQNENMELKEPDELPSALDHIQDIIRKKGDRTFLFFFDFDGTLAPIVDQPDQAALPKETYDLLQKLAKNYKVAIVSGRDRKDIEAKMNLHHLYYAGSHGFDIAGPNGMHHQHPEADSIIPELEKISHELEQIFKEKKQVKIEKKKFAIAIHHRGAEQEVIKEVEKKVKERLSDSDQLKWDKGKSIIEIKPNVDWNKGKAVLWIMDQLGMSEDKCLPVYLGDDTTDEDAFRELQEKGVSIMIEDHDQKTYAQYALNDQKQVADFIQKILSHV